MAELSLNFIDTRVDVDVNIPTFLGGNGTDHVRKRTTRTKKVAPAVSIKTREFKLEVASLSDMVFI